MIIVSRSRLFSIIALLLLVLPYMSACGQAELTSAEYVTKAQDYFDNDEYKAAVISLKNALLKDPDNLEARWLMARAAIEIGDGAAAEKEIGRAIDLGLSMQAAQPLQIKAVFLQSDFERVIEETGVIVEGLSNTDKAMILGLRGQAYLEMRKFSEAKQAFDAALELDAKSVTGLVGMGRLNALQGEFAEARRWTQLALDADTSASEPWTQLGELEWTEGNAEAAEAAFSEAIKLSRTPTLVFTRRALARIYLGDFAGAEADIRTLKQAGIKNNPTVDYVEGIGYFKQEKYREAAEAFEAALRVRPSYLQAKMYLASTYLIQGKVEQAQVLAEQVNVSLPNYPGAKNLLGTTQARQSDFEAATKTFEASLRQSPNNSETLSMLGTLALMDGDAPKGVEYFQKAVEIEPDSQYARQRLMFAKLLAGQGLDSNMPSNIEPGSYESEFLIALAAFRQQNFGIALERAQALHQQYPGKVDPLNLMAACYLTLSDWPKAREVLGQVLAIDPADPNASKNLARIEVADGNLEQAEALLQRLVAAHPDDREAVLLLVDLKARLGDLAAATQVLESALERSPDDALILALLVEKSYQTGRLADVLDLTREVKEQQVREQPALVEYRGRVQYMLGDNRAAQRSFKRWIAARPDSPQAHFWLANSLAGSGDLKRAGKELEIAIELDAGFLPARLAQVKVLAQQGRNEKAEQALADVKEEFGEKAQVLGVAGWLAMQEQDYASAEALFAKASAQGQDTELTLMWAKALGAQNKPDVAFKLIHSWLEEHPQDITVLLTMAGLYMGMDRPDDARIAYEKVVEIIPRHVFSLNNLAWLNKDRDPNQAISYAERAYQLAPGDPQVQDTLGILLLKRGDTTRGAELVRDAAALAPNNAEIQLHLAEALVQQKKYAEAERLLNTLIESQKDVQIVAEAERLLKSLPNQH